MEHCSRIVGHCYGTEDHCCQRKMMAERIMLEQWGILRQGIIVMGQRGIVM